MPSVIALLESREARAREELESWLEVVREAEEHAAAARQRLEHARIACDEVLRALAEEGELVAGRARADQESVAVPEAGDDASSPALACAQETTVAAVPAPASVLRPGYDPRPPVWQPGMGDQSLSGAYRQVFAAVVAAAEPVSAQELTRALGRDASRLNEVEKVRHRAYALEARGWLVRERGGVFRTASPPAGAGGTRASAGAGAPSSASG